MIYSAGGIVIGNGALSSQVVRSPTNITKKPVTKAHEEVLSQSDYVAINHATHDTMPSSAH
jgi:hypothetical protein